MGGGKFRDQKIDIIKGILIILVVIGHSHLGKKAVISLTSFIGVFHMPCFFMVSGYLFSFVQPDWNGLINYLKRKIKALWVPYFFMTVILIIFNNVFIKINFYTNNTEILELGAYGSIHHFMSASDMLKEILKAFFFGAHVELGGTFWFFKALFSVACLYCIIEWFVRRVIGNRNDMVLKLQSAISIFFLLIGFTCSIYDVSLLGMARSFSIYSLFHFGRLIKKKNLNQYYKNRMAMLLSIGVLIGFSFLKGFSLDMNNYVNPIFLFVASSAGWCLLNYLSDIVLNSNKVMLFLSKCGKASLYIMVLHLISFKLVNILQVWIYGLPKYYVASFPVLYRNEIWAIVYSFVGVLVPLVIYMFKEIIQRNE